MSFGALFDKTLNEYQKNWKELSKFILVFRGLPILFFTIVAIVLVCSSPVFAKFFTTQTNFGALGPTSIETSIFTAIESIISLIFLLYVYSAITSAYLKKNNPSFKELTDNGSKNFFGYLAFTIVSTIFIFLLFLLLIIPGIIFAVFWTLGVYIFLDSKERHIRKSLKESKQMIKGKWWKTFGYIILIALILFIIFLLFSIISLPTEILISIKSQSQVTPSPTLISANLILRAISSLLTEIISIPFAILFFKNYYLKVKSEKNKT